MIKFNDIQQVYEQPNMLKGQYAVRIYTTAHNETQVRYHVGFPSIMLTPGHWLFAETEVYLGEKHWLEVDGFHVFWLSMVGEKGEPLPIADLQEKIVWMVGQINKALSFLRSAR